MAVSCLSRPRWTSVVIVGLAVVALTPAGARAATIAKLPLVSPLSANVIADHEVIATGLDPQIGPPGEHYFAFTGSPSRSQTPGVSAMGFSSQPFDVGFDPRSGSASRLAFSRCPATGGRGSARCSVYIHQLVGGDGTPDLLEETPSDVADRLPSMYGGAVAFARVPTGGIAAQLRYRASGAAASVAVPGGPKGTEEARPTGVALRGRRLAYVWKWHPRPGQTSYALRLHDLAGRTRTILKVDGSRHRLLGPTWDRGRLIFAMRSGSRARWGRYTPATRRLEAAQAPTRLASFAVGGPVWYAQAGAGCTSSSACSLRSVRQPRFHATRSRQGPYRATDLRTLTK